MTVRDGSESAGFSTKIHLKVDLGGLPLAFHLTGGEASDSRNFEVLLDLGPDIAPRAAITDKGYDAKANRDDARRRGICPVIPFKSNAIDKPAFFPKILYKARARIEQAVGKLKRFKRIALRCEKTAQNYSSFVALALGFILVKNPQDCIKKPKFVITRSCKAATRKPTSRGKLASIRRRSAASLFATPARAAIASSKRTKRPRREAKRPRTSRAK